KSLDKMAASNGSFVYSGLLSTASITGGSGYLDAGTFSVSGPGGADVGGFNASIAIPSPLNWSNQAAITDVTRANGQNVTWTGADSNGTVLISGYSSTGADANAVGANFICVANAGDGQFTIPAQVLLAMPASVTVSGVPTGALLVGSNTAPVSFSASGIDVGYLVGTVYSLKNVNFK
ncbi:MAG: hypothetical protein KGN84_15595, partial [Acidobacteriota bacterium]|nr:hypothetical protein [Acidobacteriota bacterium]